VILVRKAVCAAFVLGMLCGSAHAQTAVRCDLAPTTALGAAVAAASPGAVLAITGMCRQQVTIRSVFDWDVTITNDQGNVSAPLVETDGIEGQIRIVGPLPVTIAGITLQGGASDLGYDSVVSVEGASATIANARIVDGWRNGVLIANGKLTLANVAVTGNGRAGIAGQNDGIRVTGSAMLTIGRHAADGSIDAANAVTIANNAGNGLAALLSSSITMVGGAVEGNGASQVFLDGASTASLFGTHVTQSAPSAMPGNFAIEALQTSRLMLAQAATVEAAAVAGGVLAASSSSLVMMGSSVANTTTLNPTVEVRGSSNMMLAGGNAIANASNGAAIEIDRSSSLMQDLVGALAGEFAGVAMTVAPAPDQISGFGMIQHGSSVDLGAGLIGGGNSLVWTGTLSVAQNSVFRLTGGTLITGVLVLGQGSSAFFNLANGGANTVTGGVLCPWSLLPSARVSAVKNGLSPPPQLAATIAGAAPNQCLAF
jgi:hypothetical protein